MKWGGGVKVGVVGMHRAWSSKRGGEVWGCVWVFVYGWGGCALSLIAQRGPFITLLFLLVRFVI